VTRWHRKRCEWVADNMKASRVKHRSGARKLQAELQCAREHAGKRPSTKRCQQGSGRQEQQWAEQSKDSPAIAQHVETHPKQIRQLLRGSVEQSKQRNSIDAEFDDAPTQQRQQAPQPVGGLDQPSRDCMRRRCDRRVGVKHSHGPQKIEGPSFQALAQR
jgi:hypothetical protein